MTQLSDVVVSQLGIAEQLMLWALRQRRADSGATTPELVQGFLLACGLAGVEPALGSFERLFDTLQQHGRCGLGPLRCAVVSHDEVTCLALVAAAQQGHGAKLDRLAAALVEPLRVPDLAANAQRLADALTRAGYRLDPPLKLRSPPRVVHRHGPWPSKPGRHARVGSAPSAVAAGGPQSAPADPTRSGDGVPVLAVPLAD